jgi:cleavage and polyadenylation specificity factor subunit 2
MYTTSVCSASQLYSLSNRFSADKGEGIVIAPHVSGHLLGGTVWKITKDGEDVIYAVDFNHRKERFDPLLFLPCTDFVLCSLNNLVPMCLFRHLNGTALGSFVRPAVLITDAYNALNNQVYKRQQDQDFIGTLLDQLPNHYLFAGYFRCIIYQRLLVEVSPCSIQIQW